VEATGNNTIVVLPWGFKGGTDGARQKAGQELEMLLGGAGFSVHSAAADVQIADTRTGAFALYVRDVAIDSTGSTSAFRPAAEMIPNAGVAVGFLSAGPKTPGEQRAVLLATSYALMPWIETWQQVNGITEHKAATAVVRNR
jgi:hypothetical protein